MPYVTFAEPEGYELSANENTNMITNGEYMYNLCWVSLGDNGMPDSASRLHICLDLRCRALTSVLPELVNITGLGICSTELVQLYWASN